MHHCTGTVKFFNDDKGYGFITPVDGSQDVFVQHRKVEDHIQCGDAVVYDVELWDKGLSVVAVCRS